jgi:hypothetical protein
MLPDSWPGFCKPSRTLSSVHPNKYIVLRVELIEVAG